MAVTQTVRLPEFRAVDEKDGTIYHVNHIDNLNNSEEVRLWTNDVTGGYQFYAKSIEQYIGIKDKNGTKIYEGDLIKCVNPEVEFEDTLYQVVYNETGNYPAFDLKGWDGEINGISDLVLNYGVVVVGNIHNNPELLENANA